jgi:hypothetical protein
MVGRLRNKWAHWAMWSVLEWCGFYDRSARADAPSASAGGAVMRQSCEGNGGVLLGAAQ